MDPRYKINALVRGHLVGLPAQLPEPFLGSFNQTASHASWLRIPEKRGDWSHFEETEPKKRASPAPTAVLARPHPDMPLSVRGCPSMVAERQGAARAARRGGA